MIEKKDWETAKKSFNELTANAKNVIINSEVNLELYNVLIPFIEGKIKSFPEEAKEADPMPEAVKDIVAGVK